MRGAHLPHVDAKPLHRAPPDATSLAALLKAWLHNPDQFRVYQFLRQ